jgi:serine/threonine protein phosphatase PrpC
LRVGILDGFERANQAVTQLGNGAATTMTVVAVEGTEVRPFHAGDSPVLVVGQRGRIKLQSVSHSPVGYAVAAGYLDENEALHHDDRHLILNAVGSATMRVEVGAALDLAPRDTLLLGSDGLFDNLYPEEIVQLVRMGPLGPTSRALTERCLERMQAPRDGTPSKADDLTFVLYRRHPPRRRQRREQT